MRRTIMITGAGGALGRALSLDLAARGHRILATGLDLGSVLHVAEEITRLGGEAEAFRLDVASEPEVAALWGELAGRPVDVLIHNAGLQHVARVEDFPAETWSRLVDTMVKGAFLLSRAALPGMRERGFGRIISIGSIHSLVGSPFKSAYVAAKHALVGLSKVLALETADVDITCNTICPAYIRTPLVEAQIQDQAAVRGIPESEVVERIMLAPMPKGTFISAEEVAEAIEYFMSAGARNVTGQTLAIDGGWTLQ